MNTKALHSRFEPGDALIVVDVQKDFCPGGTLAIDAGDRVVPVLNRFIDEAVRAGVPVIASRCWHPRDHPSFSEQGGQWPVHCLQDSDGARFHPDLALPEQAIVVTKGVRFDHDQNSAFDDTGLADYLRAHEVRRVWVGGLAEDVCVRATVLEARREGFEAVLLCEATCPVTAEGGERALREMREAGAVFEALA